jgi:hypothetical protein
MPVTIGVFLMVRVPVETWLRPHLQPPVTVTGAAEVYLMERVALPPRCIRR